VIKVTLVLQVLRVSKAFKERLVLKDLKETRVTQVIPDLRVSKVKLVLKASKVSKAFQVRWVQQVQSDLRVTKASLLTK
jgi:hypothetical protein